VTKPSVRTVESLGKVSYQTKSSTANIIAGFILAGILFAGGLFLAGYMVRQMFLPGGQRPQSGSDWGGAIMTMVLGIAVAIGGVFLFLFARSLVGFRLYVCSDGFWITRHGQSIPFAWDEIAQIKECHVTERLQLVKGAPRRLAATKTTKTYTVIRCDGEQFYFDENVLSRTSLLAGPLSGAARRLGIPWETEKQDT
jgi:hypothetical protein